jgi:hypothetical protein
LTQRFPLRSDAFAAALPFLRACVDAETRLLLAAAGKPRTQRLGEAARAALVPTGSGYAQASLGGAVAALQAQPPDARAAALQDAAALARVVTDAARAVAAARAPAAQIKSGAIAAHLVPAPPEPAGAEPLLGRVRMSYDPCGQPPAPAAFTLTLGGAAAEGLPLEYALQRAADVPPAHVFGEPAATAASGGPPGAAAAYAPLAGLPPGGVVSAEGCVERKFDAVLLDAADDAHYRRLSRARMTAAGTKTRVAKQVAAFTPLGAAGGAGGAGGALRGRAPAAEAAPLRVPLPARQNALSKAALAGGRAPEKRARMDAEELKALLFGCFAARSHWKIADLERRTDQPLAHLKQVLASIAEMDRAPGPNRGSFQLLPHLRAPADAE